MSSILVLGANSFTGVALIPELLSRGMTVHAISRSSLDTPPHPHLFWHKGSIANSRLLRRILPKCKCAIHLASSTTPGISSQNPVLEGTNNIVPTLRFIEVAQSFPDIHIIYASSGGAIYGDTCNPCVSEDTCVTPISYYGAGKASIETFFNTLHYNMGHRITIIRPSNIYGPGQNFRKSFGLIRTLIERAKTNQAIEIWGDGNSVRDYLYIDDYINACLQVITSKSAPTSETYNVGSGVGHNINDIIRMIENSTETKLKKIYRTGRSSDVKHIVLDSSSFHQKFSWQPEIDLQTGIKRTWQWLKTQ